MKLQIKVNSPKLSEIVQKLLFEAGYSWGMRDQTQTVQFTESIFLFFDSGRGDYITQVSDPDYRDQSFPLLDASTQMGELIELIQNKKEIIIKSVTEKYDGKISLDKSFIEVGCQKVSRGKVKEIYEAMLWQ